VPAGRGGPGAPGGWRHPGWAWTVRYGGAITAGWGAVTLLFGGALGGVYSLTTADLDTTGAWVQLWLTIGLAVVAAGIATACLVVMRGGDRMRAQNGTAYILKEEARGWDQDDASRFLAETRRQFARVITVPGPAALDKGWDWALDDAGRWDGRVNSLAVAFRALHADDDPASPNGLFMWAWWSVALAFGLRVTAAERGLSLDVWQRPSFGRTSQQAPVPWASRPHAFGSSGDASGSSAEASGLPARPVEVQWPVRLTVSPGRSPTAVASRDAALLLIRVGHQAWGSIPDARVTPSPEPGKRYDLHVRDAAAACIDGQSEVVLHELRYDVPSVASVPWSEFPALVAACADWLTRQAASLAGRTLLLGAVIPPEVALGLGIRAGQASRGGWPSHLWPLMHSQADGLVVPRLNLGTASVEGA
jgi:hypothetical protein